MLVFDSRVGATGSFHVWPRAGRLIMYVTHLEIYLPSAAVVFFFRAEHVIDIIKLFGRFV